MGLTAYIFIAFILLIGFLIYLSHRIAETHEDHKPSKGQKVACIGIFAAEIIWFAVFLFGIWFRLGLPEFAFDIVCLIVIAPGIAYPSYLLFRRKTFFVAILSISFGTLFLILLGLLTLISRM